jgi:hypothetical protein
MQRFQMFQITRPPPPIATRVKTTHTTNVSEKLPIQQAPWDFQFLS